MWKENNLKHVKTRVSLSRSLIGRSSSWKSLLSPVPPNLSIFSPLSLSFPETLNYTGSAFSSFTFPYILFQTVSNLLSLYGWFPKFNLWPRLLSQVLFLFSSCFWVSLCREVHASETERTFPLTSTFSPGIHLYSSHLTNYSVNSYWPGMILNEVCQAPFQVHN